MERTMEKLSGLLASKIKRTRLSRLSQRNILYPKKNCIEGSRSPSLGICGLGGVAEGFGFRVLGLFRARDLGQDSKTQKSVRMSS